MEEEKKEEKKVQKRNPKANLYVYDINLKVTQKMFFDTFKIFGVIESCVLKTKPDGTSQGYGFV